MIITMKNRFEIRGEITAIFLVRRDGTVLETLIDTKCLPKVQEFDGTWYAVWEKKTKSFYVYGTGSKQSGNFRPKLHRFLLDAPDSLMVDHINHDTLDNRLCNLRLVTNKENQWNSRAKHTGVCWHKRDKCWQARLKVDGKLKHIGNFKDRNAALIAVGEARKKYRSGVGVGSADVS